MARRVAFITGASRGTGKATALALAREEGMSCFLVSRERTTLEVAAAEVARHVGPGAVDIFPADVTDDEALGAAVGACVERFGRLDVLVVGCCFAIPSWHFSPRAVLPRG